MFHRATMVCLPGLHGGLAQFIPVTARLKGNWRIADATVALRRNESIPFAAKDLMETTLKATKEVILLGHSYGGMVALEVAKQLLEGKKSTRLKGCVLLSTTASRRSKDLPYAIAERRDNVLKLGLQAELDMTFDWGIDKSVQGDLRAFLRASRNIHANDAGPRVFCKQCDAVDARPDQHATLKLLAAADIPLLLLHGANDLIVPVSEALKSQETLKSSGGNFDFTVLEHTGHAPHQEKKQHVTNLIQAWLSTIDLF